MDPSVCRDCGGELKSARVEGGKGSRDSGWQIISFCPECHPNLIMDQIDDPSGFWGWGCLVPIAILLIFILFIYLKD